MPSWNMFMDPKEQAASRQVHGSFGSNMFQSVRNNRLHQRFECIVSFDGRHYRQATKEGILHRPVRHHHVKSDVVKDRTKKR